MLTLSVLVGVASAPITASADQKPNSYFSTCSTTSTVVASAFAYAVVSANGNGGHPCVEFVNAQSDTSGGLLRFYNTWTNQVVTTNSAAAQNIIYCPGSTYFAANDIIVIRNKAGDTYQRLVVSNSAAQSIGTYSNLVNAVVAGDIVYQCRTNMVLPFSAASLSTNFTASGGVLYAGERDKPILVEVTFTNTSGGRIGGISGSYRQ